MFDARRNDVTLVSFYQGKNVPDEYVNEMKTVSEKEIIDAVKFLFFRLKLVVEPSGALGIAALLSSKVSVDGRVGVIISGGNIDAPTMKMILDS